MAVVFRILSRLLLVGVLGAVLRGRRGGVPPWRTPGTGAPTPGSPSPQDVLRERGRRLARGAVEGARLAGRVVALAAFALAAAAFTAAGTTLTSLGPRWLGAVLLAGAVVMAVLAAVELRAVWRIRTAQARRREDARLRRSDG